MPRETGEYRVMRLAGEEVRAFVPFPLPPDYPPLATDEGLLVRLTDAMSAVGRLGVAGELVASPGWFLYGFVRKEALITSQIEGTQATLQDVLAFEAGEPVERPDDVREVCNYVDALTYARREIARPRGLPLCMRLLCEAHKRLMKGSRGSDKQPGEIRRSQNWIGGSRPGNARFVPPPPEEVGELLSSLEKWIHLEDPLPPLVRAGLAHVQFETIHPFLDGNGRIGRLLIALLVEKWGMLRSPLLYLSAAFKRSRDEYYARLSAVRTEGDWEGWTAYFLGCVREAADDGVDAAQRLFRVVSRDREKLLGRKGATVVALRLFDRLPNHPLVTSASAARLLKISKPTANKALAVLQKAGVLQETTGKQRDRTFVYRDYLGVLTKDTE